MFLVLSLTTPLPGHFLWCNFNQIKSRLFWLGNSSALYRHWKRPTQLLLENTQQTDLVTMTSCARGIRQHRNRGLALGSAGSCPCHHTGLLAKQDSVSRSCEIQDCLSKPWTDTDARRKILKSPVSGPLSKSLEADGQAQRREPSAFYRRLHWRRKTKRKERAGKNVQPHSCL